MADSGPPTPRQDENTSQIQNVERELKRALAQLSVREEEQRESLEVQARLEKENEDLLNQIQVVTQNLSDQVVSIKVLQQKYSTLEDMYNDEHKRFESEITSKIRQIANLEEELMHCHDDIEELAQELEESHAHEQIHETLEDALHVTSDSLASLAEFQRLESVSATLELSTDMEHELYQRLLDERKKTKSQAKKLDSVFLKLETAQLESRELENMKRDFEALQNQQHGATEFADETNRALADEVVIAARRNAQLQQEVDDLQSIIAEKDLLISELDVEVNMVQESTRDVGSLESEYFASPREPVLEFDVTSGELPMIRDTSLSTIHRAIAGVPQPTPPPPKPEPPKKKEPTAADVPDVLKEYLYLTASAVKLKFPHVVSMTSEDLIKLVDKKPFFQYHDAMMDIMRLEEAKINPKSAEHRDSTLDLPDAIHRRTSTINEDQIYKAISKQLIVSNTTNQQLEAEVARLRASLKSETFSVKYLADELHRVESGSQETLENVKLEPKSRVNRQRVTLAGGRWLPFIERNVVTRILDILFSAEEPLRSAEVSELYDTAMDIKAPVIQKFLAQRLHLEEAFQELKLLFEGEVEMCVTDPNYYAKLVQYQEKSELFSDYQTMHLIYGAVHGYFLTNRRVEFQRFVAEIDNRATVIDSIVGDETFCQPKMSLLDMFVNAVITQNCLRRLAENLSAQCHGSLYSAGVKSLYRMWEKMAFSLTRQWVQDLWDICRVMISFQSFDDLLAAFQELNRSDDVEIISVVNGFSRERKDAWQDLTIYVRFTDQKVKVISEIRLSLEKFSIERRRLGEHDDYAPFRSAVEVRKLVQRRRGDEIMEAVGDDEWKEQENLSVEQISDLHAKLSAAAVKVDFPDIEVDVNDLVKSVENLPFFLVHSSMVEMMEGGGVSGMQRNLVQRRGTLATERPACASCFF